MYASTAKGIIRNGRFIPHRYVSFLVNRQDGYRMTLLITRQLRKLK